MMPEGGALLGQALEWEQIDGRLRVVRLTPPLRLLIPALFFPSLPVSTRGMTLYPGRMGLAIGAVLLLASVAIGDLLWAATGALGAILSVWTLGTAGGATVLSSFRPVAFVKPICVKCRLLPVIREHEAIHLTGISSENEVWAQMRRRHSVQSLSLEGDPAICSFCPIPKRLAQQ